MDGSAARAAPRARLRAGADRAARRASPTAPDLLAFGGELKATFCLRQGRQGDPVAASGRSRGRRDLRRLPQQPRRSTPTLFDHAPAALAADRHPDYLLVQARARRARAKRLPLVEVQHHHAHVAACLAENGRPLDAPAGARHRARRARLRRRRHDLGRRVPARRLSRGRSGSARFKPVAMLGGDAAAREPWRNLYAHLMAEMGWAELAMNFAELDLYRDLAAQPRATLDAMIRERHQRAAGLVLRPAVRRGRRRARHLPRAPGLRGRGRRRGSRRWSAEQTLARRGRHARLSVHHPATCRGSGLPYIEPLAMWHALLGDLILDTPAPVIAARFHKGLATVVVAMAQKLRRRRRRASTRSRCRAAASRTASCSRRSPRGCATPGFTVLTHAQVPANDGGLALGQAAIAAARLIAATGS